ncbi:polysaccharide pyruvyl transferase family protein [uncultured Rothia sp.]|uniref:polysaccharide pyruvyl transferase family protein n=1 Tax=uncultured Rothia sp. TaxID=316088 RepID=UPI0025E3ABD2|nr:polysaccharide pyruvyl transferase family protein [uncultured Rothia sp.]
MTENAHSTYSRTPRVLVVGDIGQHAYHVGDEAMTMAAARFLHEGGCSVTLMTRDERHSARYLNAPRSTDGGGYSYLPFFLFPWSPAERELTLAALECILIELHADRARPSIAELMALPQVQALPEVLHPLEQTVERMVGFADSIAAMDAVVISGGGNLNSRFGWLLYERAAVALVAEYADVPLFVTGQSLGPTLTERDAQTLERILRSARSVSVREENSLAWCRERGIDARLCVDDATDAAPEYPSRTLDYTADTDEADEVGTAHVVALDPSELLGALPERYVCVTVNACTQEQAERLAGLLDRVHREHGCAPVFLSHFGDPLHADQPGRRGDADTHERIAGLLSPAAREAAIVLPILHTDQSLLVHRAAALTITSRYHPAVFSAAAGIPVLALIPDAFTQVRVGGALSLYGWGEFTLPLGMLAGGVPELMVAAALRCAAADSGARRAELLEALRAERAYLLAQILAHCENTYAEGTPSQVNTEAEPPAPFPAATQVPALPEPLGATVRAARDLFTATSLTAGFEWAMSDRAHSWDAEHRLRLERARISGGMQGIHGAHGAEEPRPVAVEPESSSDASAEGPTAHPSLLARVVRRLRG